MPLSGFQFQQLQEALLHAFPNRSALARMVQFGLDQNLDTIVGTDALADVVFQLIRWAEAKGKTEQLVASACHQNPDNPALKAFMELFRSSSVGSVPSAAAPQNTHATRVSASSPPSFNDRSPIELFYSYSHTDEKLREKLETNLTVLKRQGVIGDWHIRKVGTGQEWANQIDPHIHTAQIILLLVSADFLASAYCYDMELKRAIERHEVSEAQVIPVILKPCTWQGAPFGKLPALPKDAKPVTAWTLRDSAFENITQGVCRAIYELTKRPLRSSAISTGDSASVAGRTRYRLVLETDVIDSDLVIALLKHNSGDSTLSLERIMSGSIVLILNGTEQGFLCLASMFLLGDVTDIAGIPIKDISREVTLSEGYASEPLEHERIMVMTALEQLARDHEPERRLLLHWRKQLAEGRQMIAATVHAAIGAVKELIPIPSLSQPELQFNYAHDKSAGHRSSDHQASVDKPNELDRIILRSPEGWRADINAQGQGITVTIVGWTSADMPVLVLVSRGDETSASLPDSSEQLLAGVVRAQFAQVPAGGYSLLIASAEIQTLE